MRKRWRARLEDETGKFLLQLPRGLLARVVECPEYRGATLDPPMALLVRLIAAAKKPPLESLPIDVARRKFQQWVAPFDVPHAELAHVEDRTLRGIPVRVYRSNLDAPQPATIFFHGGGFVIGTLDGYDRLCRHLANRTGGAVISVDYRLAPEHCFPAAQEDACVILEAIAGGAIEGIDTQHLAVAGDSAGGGLAAVAAIHARDRGIPLRLQYLIYPATDLRHETASFRDLLSSAPLLTEGLLRWFEQNLNLSVEDRCHWRASPVLAENLTGVCPARVITAGFDPLRDEGEDYARKLEAAGVPVTSVCYANQPHGFAAFGGVHNEARKMLDDWVRTTRAAFS
jgi:acetyl esterase